MHSSDIRTLGCPLEAAGFALILLHGRGASAEDILGLAPYFVDETWHVAAPQATGGTWYPFSFMAPVIQNEPWLSGAIDNIHQLIENIKRVIPANKIYVAGFSQGACLATEVTARHAENFGGIIGFTGGLIGDKINDGNYQGTLDGTPVYLSNGDSDPHVPRQRSEETKRQLEKMGGRVVLDIFEGRPHTISQEEIGRARKWVFELSKQ